MSSRSFDKALHLKPETSYLLAGVLVVLHLAALLSITVAFSLDFAGVFFLIILFAVSLGYYLRKYIFSLSKMSVASITQTSEGDWSLRFANGELVDASLSDDSYNHPLLVVLNFVTDSGRVSIPLFRDALPGDLHRQLRRRLSLSRPAQRERLFRR